MTIAVMLILAALVTVGSQRVRDAGATTTAASVLASVQLEAQRYVSVAGEFPVGIVANLTSASTGTIEVIAGTSTGNSTVSATRADQNTLITATVSGNDCLVLVERLQGTDTWAVFVGDRPACNAAGLSSAAQLLVHDGSAVSPQRVGS